MCRQHHRWFADGDGVAARKAASLMNDAAGSGSQRGFAYTAWLGSAAGNYYSVGIGVELEAGWAVGMVASPCQY